MPVFLNTADASFETDFVALLGRKREEAEDVDQAVAQIIADVRARGDEAVIDLTARFDRLSLTWTLSPSPPPRSTPRLPGSRPRTERLWSWPRTASGHTTPVRNRRTKAGLTVPGPCLAGAGPRLRRRGFTYRVGSPPIRHPS